MVCDVAIANVEWSASRISFFYVTLLGVSFASASLSRRDVVKRFRFISIQPMPVARPKAIVQINLCYSYLIVSAAPCL